MSIQAINFALKANGHEIMKASGIEERTHAAMTLKAVLFVMANHARPDGSNCHVFVATIMKEASIDSDRTVQGAISVMIKAGVLVSADRVGRANCYSINLNWKPPVDPSKPVPAKVLQVLELMDSLSNEERETLQQALGGNAPQETPSSRDDDTPPWEEKEAPRTRAQEPVYVPVEERGGASPAPNPAVPAPINSNHQITVGLIKPSSQKPTAKKSAVGVRLGRVLSGGARKDPDAATKLAAPDLSWLRHEIRDLGDAFLASAGETYLPTNGGRSLWQKELRVWASFGATPLDVEKAVDHMRKEKLTIKDVVSVTGTLRDIVAKRVDTPAGESKIWIARSAVGD